MRTYVMKCPKLKEKPSRSRRFYPLGPQGRKVQISCSSIAPINNWQGVAYGYLSFTFILSLLPTGLQVYSTGERPAPSAPPSLQLPLQATLPRANDPCLPQGLTYLALFPPRSILARLASLGVIVPLIVSNE